LASLFLSACESDNPTLEKLDNTFLKRNPQTLVDQGATRLTTDQARAHVSGNTEFWSEGTVYYNPDGQLELVWLKVKSTGSWDVSADGDVCFTVPTWNKSCHYYLQLDDTVTSVTNGKTSGVLKVEPGKHLLR
jgi:hypothetical protein